VAPRFLPLEAVLAIHHDQVNTFGGSHGLRDQGLLESALGQARQTYGYTNDIYQAAAQYCVSIAKITLSWMEANVPLQTACLRFWS